MKRRMLEGFALVLMLVMLSTSAFCAMADAPEIDFDAPELVLDGEGELLDDEGLILEGGAVLDDNAIEAELALDELLDIQLAEDLLIDGTDGAALDLDTNVVMNGGSAQTGPEETTDSVTVSDGMDNDALFEAWMKQALPGMTPGRTLRSALSGRASLDGINLKLYDALAPMIREVANGTRTGTEFAVDGEAVGLEDSWWTAEQLGLDSLDDKSVGSALLAKEGFNSLKIMQALLLDCPYDLYWFDKATGGMGWGFNIVEYGEKVRVTKLTAKMAVAADYSRTGAIGAYEVNDRPARVTIAVDNINGIVNDNRSRDDLSKLKAYANVICSLVDYNYEAAKPDNNTPYGDPWQLVCIFDNDDSTKVVCEGYSKGFKYLCDLSDFDGDVACELMSGSIPAGNHMWNAVRMPDGYCYPVDLTNSDGGSVCNERIFLKGCTEQTDSSFKCDTLTYTYNTNTLANFSRAWLTMSGFSYGSITSLGYSGVYDGYAHGIVVTMKKEVGTVRYGTQKGDYSLAENPAWKDAGEYTVYYCVSSGDFGAVEGKAKVTITPKPVGLNWGNTSFTYDGSTHAPTATATGILAGDSCAVSVTGGKRKAGSYTARATALSNSNYTMPQSAEQTFVIAPKTVKLKWSGSSLTYNGKTQRPTVKAAGLVSGDKCAVTVKGGRKNAGKYTVKAIKLSNANYALPKARTKTCVITKKVIKLKWSKTRLKYNGKKQKPTATATGLIKGDKCTVTVSGAQKKRGDYTATAIRLSNGNYQLPKKKTVKFRIY